MADLTLLLEAVEQAPQPLGQSCAAATPLGARSPCGEVCGAAGRRFTRPPWAARSGWRCTPTHGGGGAANGCGGGKGSGSTAPIWALNAVDYSPMRFHRTNGLRARGPRSGALARGQRSVEPGSVCADGPHVQSLKTYRWRRRCCCVEALRQRQAAGLSAPGPAEGVPAERRNGLLVRLRVGLPQVADWCRREGFVLTQRSQRKGRSSEEAAAPPLRLARTRLKWSVAPNTQEWKSSHHRDGAPSDRPGPERPAQPEGQSQTSELKQQEPTPSKTTSSNPTARMCSKQKRSRRSALAEPSNQSKAGGSAAEQT